MQSQVKVMTQVIHASHSPNDELLFDNPQGWCLHSHLIDEKTEPLRTSLEHSNNQKWTEPWLDSLAPSLSSATSDHRRSVSLQLHSQLPPCLPIPSLPTHFLPIHIYCLCQGPRKQAVCVPSCQVLGPQILEQAHGAGIGFQA